MRTSWAALLLAIAMLHASSGWAQSDEAEGGGTQSIIETGADSVSDAAIAERINEIFSEVEAFTGVAVEVEAGVVTLSGIVADKALIERAENLASRVAGVALVQNELKRDLSLDSRLAPVYDQTQELAEDAISATPLVLLAAGTFVFIIFVGFLLTRIDAFWQRITPNNFVADLAKTSVRVAFVILALVLALNILDATALLSAVLGSAGVIGLAIGFAVRDTIENYIASILLSLRQPFRPKDHVMINEYEGYAVRLTPRATVLLDMNGNQIRIPNAAVFKGTIINYTANPERRFSFQLGVDSADDPLEAIETGVATLLELPFVLNEPAPFGIVNKVGDSNILVDYFAWVNQSDVHFGKARSIALARVKQALETAGFGLPEPIYRLKLDAAAATEIKSHAGEPGRGGANADRRPPTTTPAVGNALPDVAPDTDIQQKVDEERDQGADVDLLDNSAPAE